MYHLSGWRDQTEVLLQFLGYLRRHSLSPEPLWMLINVCQENRGDSALIFTTHCWAAPRPEPLKRNGKFMYVHTHLLITLCLGIHFLLGSLLKSEEL